VPVRSILVKIGGDSKGIEKASNRSIGAMTQIGGVAKKLGASLAVAGVAGTAFFAKLTRDGLASVDAMAKLARRLDSTIDGVKAVEIAGERAGFGIGKLEDSLDKLNRAAGRAQQNDLITGEVFEMLGINVQRFIGLNADERLIELADSIEHLGLSGAETAALMSDLGIRSADMVNLLRGGSDAIRQAAKDVDEFGLSIDEVDAERVEAANDAMKDMSKFAEALKQELAIGLAPVLVGLANDFNDLQKASSGSIDISDRVTSAAITFMVRLSDLVLGLKIIWSGLKVAATGALAGILTAFSSFAEGVVSVENVIIDGVNKTIGALNKISPGEFFDIGLVQRIDESSGALLSLANTAEIVTGGFKSAREELNALLSAAATSESADEKIDRLKEELEERREVKKESMALELEDQKIHNEQLEIEEQASKDKLDAIAEAAARKKAEDEDEARRRELLSAKMGILGNIAMATSGSKKLFAIHKAAILAQALLSARETVVDAYKWGTKIGTPALGAVMAAAAAAAQAANIASIIATQPAGGGGVSSAGGGNAGTPSAGDVGSGGGGGGGGGASGQVVTINLGGGAFFDRATVLSLIEELNDAVADGAQLVIA